MVSGMLPSKLLLGSIIAIGKLFLQYKPSQFDEDLTQGAGLKGTLFLQRQPL